MIDKSQEGVYPSSWHGWGISLLLQWRTICSKEHSSLIWPSHCFLLAVELLFPWVILALTPWQWDLPSSLFTKHFSGWAMCHQLWCSAQWHAAPSPGTMGSIPGFTNANHVYHATSAGDVNKRACGSEHLTHKTIYLSIWLLVFYRSGSIWELMWPLFTIIKS